jgi:hypothetical protein
MCDIEIYCVALPDIAFSIMRGEYKLLEAGTHQVENEPDVDPEQKWASCTFTSTILVYKVEKF